MNSPLRTQYARAFRELEKPIGQTDPEWLSGTFIEYARNAQRVLQITESIRRSAAHASPFASRWQPQLASVERCAMAVLHAEGRREVEQGNLAIDRGMTELRALGAKLLQHITRVCPGERLPARRGKRVTYDHSRLLEEIAHITRLRKLLVTHAPTDFEPELLARVEQLASELLQLIQHRTHLASHESPWTKIRRQAFALLCHEYDALRAAFGQVGRTSILPPLVTEHLTAGRGSRRGLPAAHSSLWRPCTPSMAGLSIQGSLGWEACHGCR